MGRSKKDKSIKTMYGCKIGDRIVCSCDKHPNCSFSGIEFTVKSFDPLQKGMRMIDDSGKIEAYCSNHPNAKIRIINKRKKK